VRWVIASTNHRDASSHRNSDRNAVAGKPHDLGHVKQGRVDDGNRHERSR
jgi:hypothetical protein